MFCNNCGSTIKGNANRCKKCGSVNIVASPNQNIVYNRANKQKGSAFLWIFGLVLTLILLVFTVYVFFRMKTEFTGWLIAIVILLLSGLLQKLLGSRGIKSLSIIFILSIILVGGTFIFTTDFDKVPIKSLFNRSESVIDETKNTSDTEDNNNTKIKYDSSSVVSLGVNRDDLGNIMNGQYYFDDGKNKYYSTFDNNNLPHIYKIDSSGEAKTIFDGFGWSLVVYEDWLYFSGNTGAAIDGTYNLFRIKTDGNKLEKINTALCYNMSFYDKWLYYIKKDSYNSTSYSFCRSDLDGKNEEVIIDSGGNCGIVYNNKIYYLDNNGMCMSTNPDGSNKVNVLTNSIKFFIIGNGSIIYLDTDSNIMTADIDGKNAKLVKKAGPNPPYTINSYKNTIFYTEYNTTAVEGRSAYQYDLKSIQFDGAKDKKIYTGISYGFYINIINDKVYVLDYAVDTASGKMIAVSKNMGLDGSNLKSLPRN
jgi:energy-coupling factor transporter transmembrane protein EcfT